ncbi:uncharacterized protein K444DRAFT_619657 [Hyaloscypha bicolor E]|uniref:Uncharacterized protein n=1 Tax=Hyaloscypha bicolor E TaxID=1095630 RepID=A0A2J6SQC0_9HELO|nr:uncharacterized protein K444DRAFT_619657 [Hyaloscypha bicolor E]PMD52966.1 hypothetical protein K444DRAFT_619657 [Hyaloscypha bicolor E]
MARDSTAMVVAHHGHEDDNPLLDRVEAELFAKMENGSAREGRHKQSQKGPEDEGDHKKRKKKHRHSSQRMSSQDIDYDADGMSVDLDAPQRYIPASEKKRKSEHKESQHERKSSGSLGRGVFEGVAAMVDTETPKKKRKLDEKCSPENLEFSYVGKKPGAGNIGALETLKSTPRKHKKNRKLDGSVQSTPIQLNSIPVHDAKSYLTTIIKTSPPAALAKAEENAFGMASRNKKKLKLSQESPLHLHTIPAHESPATSNHIHFDQDNNGADGVSERKKKKKKKKKAKLSGESVGKTFLVPSSLLTPAAKANGDLLQTVLKGSISHSSSNISSSEEARKASSVHKTSSIEDKTKEPPRVETPIRPPKSKLVVPTSPFPICPQGEAGHEIRKETPIPPPKRLVPTANRSPVILPQLARPKKVKAESMADSEENDEERETKKRKKSGSKTAKSKKGAAEEETFSQTITSIKGATDLKIHELFSNFESDEEEDPFVEAMDSIKRSSSKLQNLFSARPDTLPTPAAHENGEKGGSSAKVARARSVSVNTVQPLVFNDEGVNKPGDDWETTIGKVRSTAGGDDDSEAQENIAFSSSYVASRPNGIKISNTTFQVHNLRHNEGWVVSSSSDRESNSDGKVFQLKICTVISGRVQVRLGSNGFGIGKGSVFRVRSGEECVVRNEEKKVAAVWAVCVE